MRSRCVGYKDLPKIGCRKQTKHLLDSTVVESVKDIV